MTRPKLILQAAHTMEFIEGKQIHTTEALYTHTFAFKLKRICHKCDSTIVKQSFDAAGHRMSCPDSQ